MSEYHAAFMLDPFSRSCVRQKIAPLAGVRKQPVVAADVAVDASKAVTQVAAFERALDDIFFHRALQTPGLAQFFKGLRWRHPLQ
jgi:hypothetical protein